MSSLRDSSPVTWSSTLVHINQLPRGFTPLINRQGKGPQHTSATFLHRPHVPRTCTAARRLFSLYLSEWIVCDQDTLAHAGNLLKQREVCVEQSLGCSVPTTLFYAPTTSQKNTALSRGCSRHWSLCWPKRKLLEVFQRIEKQVFSICRSHTDLTCNL